MNGPQNYAKLSSVAEKFIKSSRSIQRPNIVKQYEYVSDGANLQAPVIEADQIHKFLSVSAPAEKVKAEFGKELNITI